eukprot:1123082-Heterocapsa_arctica.AAC.1
MGTASWGRGITKWIWSPVGYLSVTLFIVSVTTWRPKNWNPITVLLPIGVDLMIVTTLVF